VSLSLSGTLKLKKSFKVMVNHAQVEFRTAKKPTICRTFGGLLQGLIGNMNWKCSKWKFGPNRLELVWAFEGSGWSCNHNLPFHNKKRLAMCTYWKCNCTSCPKSIIT
jgi:hypothetical protein